MAQLRSFFDHSVSCIPSCLICNMLIMLIISSMPGLAEKTVEEIFHKGLNFAEI